MKQQDSSNYRELIRQRDELEIVLRAVEKAEEELRISENPGHALDRLIEIWDELKRRLSKLNQTIEWLSA